MAENPWPAEIRIGYRIYLVEIMASMDVVSKGRFGECDNCGGHIRICADLEPAEAANTMLHEVMHACWYVVNLDDEDKQERVVTSMANQLTQVWRDNPALIAAINARLL